MVFCYHIDMVEYVGGRAGQVIRFAFTVGNTGVSFFFILSGFVLAWSTPAGGGTVRFWRRRMARVYPLHLVTALLALALAFTLAPGTKPTLKPLLANLFLVQSWVPDVNFYGGVNPVSWSLACEAFFYLSFPLLIRPLRRIGWRGNAAVAAAATLLVILMPALTEYASPEHAAWAAYHFPLARLPEFVLGLALAELVRSGRWRGPGLTVSLALTMAGYFLSLQAYFTYQYAACTVIGFAALIAAAATADLKGEPSPWRGRISVKLGEISFAFYMVHILVIRTGEYIFRPHPKLDPWPWGLLVVLAAFAVSLTIAWAGHTFVENPGHKLLTRKWRRSAR